MGWRLRQGKQWPRQVRMLLGPRRHLPVMRIRRCRGERRCDMRPDNGNALPIARQPEISRSQMTRPLSAC